jgi:hypothetical protein
MGAAVDFVSGVMVSAGLDGILLYFTLFLRASGESGVSRCQPFDTVSQVR